METKEPKKTITRKICSNTGKCVESLKMKFRGNNYDTQFTSTGNKRKYFMHDMHKLAVDVTFTQTTANKDIKNHVERAVTKMYKEFR